MIPDVHYAYAYMYACAFLGPMKDDEIYCLLYKADLWRVWDGPYNLPNITNLVLLMDSLSAICHTLKKINDFCKKRIWIEVKQLKFSKFVCLNSTQINCLQPPYVKKLSKSKESSLNNFFQCRLLLNSRWC